MLPYRKLVLRYSGNTLAKIPGSIVPPPRIKSDKAGRYYYRILSYTELSQTEPGDGFGQ